MVDSVGSINWALNLDNDFRTNGGDVEDCKEVSSGVYKVTETDGDEYYVNNFGEITNFDEDPDVALKTSSNSSSYKKLSEQLSEYQDKLSDADTEKQTTSIEKKISSIESKMDKLVEKQQQKIDKLYEKLEKLQDKYSNTEKESALESLDKQMEKVQEEIDAAESELTEMQDSTSSVEDDDSDWTDLDSSWDDDSSSASTVSSATTSSTSSSTSAASTTSTADSTSVSATTATDSTTATTTTTSTTSTENEEKIATLTEEKTANTEKISELQNELNQNVAMIEEFDAKINALTKEVKDDIAEANEEVAQIIKDKEEAFQKAVDDAVEEAKNQEVKDGEEPKSFSDILAGKMTSDLSLTGTVLTAMVSAITSSSKVAKIENYVTEMTSLNNKNIDINSEITTLTERNTAIDTEIASLKTATTTKKSCDPIGFIQGDNQYDFFVDKDNNGKLSDENEFLGADKQWEEMSALDTDGDGKVTKSELSAGNVQMVKTDNAGNQSVVNVADVFSDTDFVDLSSYEAAEDGALYNNNEKQTLLGNFNINLNGTDIEGYNTLDDVAWLKENYKFDASSSEKTGDTTNVFADTSKVAENIEKYKKDIDSMNTLISETWANLGIEETTYNDFITSAKNAGKAESDREIADIKAKAEELAKANKEETEEEVQEQEETKTVTEEEETEVKIVEE